MNAKTFDPSMLTRFTGCCELYRHEILRKVLYTEGVRYVAESAGAFWLIDEVATNQLDPMVRAEEFQVWQLYVNGDSTATLSCGDGNGRTVFSKFIEFTDFPAAGIQLWFENDTILLPSEH